MNRLFIALALLTSACDEPEPAADEQAYSFRLYLAGPDRDAPETDRLVADVSEILGFHVERLRDGDPTWGAVTVSLYPMPADPHGYHGYTNPVGDPANPNDDIAMCSRMAWAYADPIVVAHEIGHMLTLHESEAGLMRSGSGSTDLSDDQWYAMARRLAALDRHCR